MGTRADFYIGIGPAAEWLGSISFDGYPDGTPAAIFTCSSEAEFREAVLAMFKPENLHTKPAEGWPWPWDDSRTTDFAYAWVDGRGVLLSRFGRVWKTLTDYRTDNERGIEDRKMNDDEVKYMKDKLMSRDQVMAKSGLIVKAGG